MKIKVTGGVKPTQLLRRRVGGSARAQANERRGGLRYKETKRERERQTEREREENTDAYVRVCVCVCVFV